MHARVHETQRPRCSMLPCALCWLLWDSWDKMERADAAAAAGKVQDQGRVHSTGVVSQGQRTQVHTVRQV